MWQKIIDFKYLIVIKYYLLGIPLAVIVYQFSTKSMLNMGLDFGSLFEKELFVRIISMIVGGLVGGLAALPMLVNKNARRNEEISYKTKFVGNYKTFFIRNVLAFSVGGLVYELLINLFGLTSFDNLIQNLFSKDFVIGYLGSILAMSVFSILLSIGLLKRLDLLYGK